MSTTDTTKQEDHTTSIEAPQVEALAAAAAAAVTASATAEATQAATVVPVITLAHTPVQTTNGRVSLLNDEDPQGKRRFFPRVKHLISNKEWEDFLTQILECIEQAGAPNCAAASHKADNAWYKAFDLIYGGIASEYSIPTGKNRYHKFKDKIVEVWVALETQEPGQHHCRDKALGQLARHRQACLEAATQKTPSGGETPTSRKSQRTSAAGGPSSSSSSSAAAALGSAAALAKLTASGSKRSFSAAMGAGSTSFGASSSSTVGSLWQNLDEKAALASLPEPLRSLVNLKQLSREMISSTSNRVTKKSIEQHGKTVDTAYLTALQNYINSNIDEEKDDDDDAAMDDDGGDDEEKEAAAKKSYDRSISMALLYRYASTVEEQRVLNDEYRKYSSKYIIHVSGSSLQDLTLMNGSEGDEVVAVTAAAAVEEGEGAPVADDDTEIEKTTAFSV